ncbi:MAG TPA: leucyl aminopeptidase family protein [Caulobacteraceae bacterium]|jgi:leucyl aminopeptidase
MIDVVLAEAPSAVPVRCVREGALDGLSAAAQEAARISDFSGQSGRVLPLHAADGGLEQVLFGVGAGGEAMLARQLPAKLPAGDYRLEDAPGAWAATAVATAFALGSYVFDRYKTDHKHGRVRLVAPEGADLTEVRRVAHACAMARDMVNTPANDMGPRQIEAVAREIAESAGAQVTVIEGDALLEANYPAVHAVGRAAAAHRAPRIVEMRWGESGPLIALVGKGVVFDSGGLNIKPGGGMRIMKKDMGGAAHALALGRMIMDAKLPVRLAVITPVVENAISGDAFRPGDVIATRKGLTVEIGNTDAEGRLILADALARAAELEPDLTIDLATLTGAARVALGPQLPPFYTDDEGLAEEIAQAAREAADPVWRMPLWSGYAEAIDSDIAQVSNDGKDWAQAGSIIAALFLKKFAPERAWAHFDIMAWNPKAAPGSPVGGEAQAIRGLYRMISRRYGGR